MLYYLSISLYKRPQHCDFLCCRQSLCLMPTTSRTSLILLFAMIMTENRWIVLFWLHHCVLRSLLSYAPAWVRQVCNLESCTNGLSSLSRINSIEDCSIWPFFNINNWLKSKDSFFCYPDSIAEELHFLEVHLLYFYEGEK